MAAPLTPLHDLTPLEGPHVDAAPRVAWLLRMARLGVGTSRSQAAIGAALRARGVKTHARMMSEVESGKQRHGRIIDGYETALGLVPGQLRAPIDTLCRAVPGAPVDRDDASLRLDGQPLDVEELSALGTRVLRPERTGGDWLRWARAMSAPEARGFPGWLAQQWFATLLSELGRSVGTSYATRFEAATTLRQGPYGTLMAQCAGEAMTTPHAQVVLDLAAVLGDHADAATLQWACELIGGPRIMVVRAACQMLLTASSSPGQLRPEHWSGVAEALATTYAAALEHQDAARLGVLGALLANLPTPVREHLCSLLGRHRLEAGRMPLPPRLGEATPSNPGWRTSDELAARIADPLGLPDRSLLARHLHEAIFDHREARAFASLQMLSALPFHERIVGTLYRWALHEAPAAHRCHTLWRLTQMAPSTTMGELPELRGRDLESSSCRAVLLAHGGVRVESAELDRLLACPEHRRRALYAAGLGQDPWLDRVLHDPAASPGLRGAVAWWQDQGGLVDDSRASSARGRPLAV